MLEEQHIISLLMHMIFELMGLNCDENSVPQGRPEPWRLVWFLCNQKIELERRWEWVLDLPAGGDSEKKKDNLIVPRQTVCHLVADPYIEKGSLADTNAMHLTKCIIVHTSLSQQEPWLRISTTAVLSHWNYTVFSCHSLPQPLWLVWAP